MRKAAGMFDRTVALAQTSSLIPELRRRFRITRIADLTQLDRIGIPVVNAIVPESADYISVYNGKGITLQHARAGAVMEAVERQMAARPVLQTKMCSRASRSAFIDLRALNMIDTSWTSPIAAVEGVNLADEAPILLPLAAVQFPWYGEKLFPAASTNGIASGNNVAEAIYHALMELVERHSVSLAHLRGHLLPRLILEEFIGSPISAWPDSFVDDAVGRRILTPTGVPTIDDILRRLDSANISVRLLALEDADLPVTIVACISEAHSLMVHVGFGASWSPEHAALRAMTEAIQSRLVDIQGAREDLLRASDPPSRFGDHGRRMCTVPQGAWFFDVPADLVALRDLPDRSSDDMAEDIKRLVRVLQKIGADQIAVVDLSPPDFPVCVVRAIVPRLESFFYDFRMGREMRRLLGPYEPGLRRYVAKSRNTIRRTDRDQDATRTRQYPRAGSRAHQQRFP